MFVLNMYISDVLNMYVIFDVCLVNACFICLCDTIFSWYSKTSM